MKAKILGMALAAAMVAPAIADVLPPTIPTIADMPRINKLLKSMRDQLAQRKAAIGQAPTPFVGDSSSTINGVAAAPGWHLATASVCGAFAHGVPTSFPELYMFDSASIVMSNNINLMALASQSCGVSPYGHQFMWHVIPGAVFGEFDQIQGLYF